MAGALTMVVFMSLVAAAVLHGSVAQTTHVVGDALGWLVPPGGAAAYSTWASMKTFRVGDVLVFNFTAGVHSVAEVTKGAFDSCNTTTTPISISTTPPTNITLKSAGEKYFLCTFPRHCDLGQKLAINVSAASSSPAPQPAAPPTSTPVPTPSPVPAVPAPTPTPPPVAAPAPSPSAVSRIYTVGDSLGWTVPPAGAVTYQTWARNKNFVVGDVLVFNFANGAHNVAEVTETSFDSCNTSSPLTTVNSSPARITLTTAGEHHFICLFPGHCSVGQKLAINVSGGGATPPTGSATPPSGAFGPSAPTNPTLSSPTSEPGNSAPSSFGGAAAALPFTVLTIAFAFLY